VLTEDAARDLAVVVGLEWSEADRELLGPLVDAALVWAEDEPLARIADPIVDALWHDARAVVVQAAFELAHVEQQAVHCLLCLEEVIAAASSTERGPLALKVARIASLR